MGNRSSKSCIVAPVTPWRKGTPSSMILEKDSFSNPSLKSNASDDSQNQAKDTDMLGQFDDVRMFEMYSRFKNEKVGVRKQSNRDFFQVAYEFLDATTNDDLLLGVVNRFVGKWKDTKLPAPYGDFFHINRFNLKEEGYNQDFVVAALSLPIRMHLYFNHPVSYRITAHMMFAFRLFSHVLLLLQDGKTERALDMLNIVALAHVIMNVTPTKIKGLISKMLKGFVHFSLITTDQLPVIVYCVYMIADQICDMMDQYKIGNETAHLRRRSDNDSVARENYRELKKWKLLILTLQKMLAVPLAQLDAQIAEEAKRIAEMERVSEVREPWRIINCLKKGYRYKDRAKAKVQAFKHWPQKEKET